jgi:prepilin-type processing-associated H-X9-DG protein
MPGNPSSSINAGNMARNAGQQIAGAEQRAAQAGGGMQSAGGARPAGPPSPPAGGGSTGAPAAAPVGSPAAATAARYLLLEVPNFNNVDDPGKQMGSYLRLGTVPDPTIAGQPDAPFSTGEDLASYANVAHLDGHVTEFLDDERIRDGCPDFVSVADRKTESSILHTKGGWRDHSDGNRITTTRGDKIEVIRGNYKLVVLGRQDDPGAGAGWDVSGGHIEGLGIKSCIEWVQTFDGTWKTIETSEKGDSDMTQHGNSVTRNYGEIITSSTGSEDEMRPTFDAEDNFVKNVPAPNPHITDRTWARMMESYTGSEKRPVPVMINETWVESMTSKTDATTMSDDTHVRRTMTSKTTVDGAMSSMTVAGAVSDTTVAGVMTNVNITDMTNLNVGPNTNITIGKIENVNIGEMLDITIAAMLQVCLSAGVSINLGPKFDFTFPEVTNLSPSKSEVSGESTSVSGARTEISEVDTRVAAVHLLV